MSELGGTFEIDGKPVRWALNPYGGWVLGLESLDAIHIAGEPNETAAKIAMGAYRQGIERGKAIGRSILQNEFRNLMDCQR